MQDTLHALLRRSRNRSAGYCAEPCQKLRALMIYVVQYTILNATCACPAFYKASTKGRCMVDLHKSPGKAVNAKINLLQLHEEGLRAAAGRVPSPQEQLALVRAEMRTAKLLDPQYISDHECMTVQCSMVLCINFLSKAWQNTAGSAPDVFPRRRMVQRNTGTQEGQDQGPALPVLHPRVRGHFSFLGPGTAQWMPPTAP